MYTQVNNRKYIWCISFQIIQHLEVELEDPEKDYHVVYNLFPKTIEPIAFKFTQRQ